MAVVHHGTADAALSVGIQLEPTIGIQRAETGKDIVECLIVIVRKCFSTRSDDINDPTSACPRFIVQVYMGLNIVGPDAETVFV
jgi:hypothetical protein